MSEVLWLRRIRLFIAILVSSLVLVLGFYLYRPLKNASTESTRKCEAIFGLVETLPNLPHFQNQIALRGQDTPAIWASRTLEIMDPYRVLFLQQDINLTVAHAQKNWSSFIDGHDCGWFSALIKPLWQHALDRLRSEIARDSGRYSSIKLGTAKDLIVARPIQFALSEKEWKRRVFEISSLILGAADAKVLKVFQENRLKYVEFTIEEMAVPTFIEPETLLTKAYLSAKDPFSAYFSPSEFADFSQELAGETTGVGIQAVRTPEGLWIQKVLPKTPAAKVLKAEDLLTHIDGLALSHLTGAISRRLLSGREGSALTLRFCRVKKCKTVTLHRQRFSPEESKIEYELRNTGNQGSQIAVISIPSFYGRSPENQTESSSSEDLESVLRELLAKHDSKKIKLGGVVLDLRGNPGGYLEESIQMASLFLGTKPVVGLRETERNRVHWGTKHEALYHGPLVALVDRGSASAAEVLAGSLKDHKRAVLIGSDRTYGKGTVQKLIPLTEISMSGAAGEVFQGAAIKLTTSVFYSPKGHTPASRGVKTDIILNSARNDGGVEAEFQNPPHFSDTKSFFKDEEVATENSDSTGTILDAQLQALRKIVSKSPAIDVKKELEAQQVDEAVVIADELALIMKAPLTRAIAPALRGETAPPLRSAGRSHASPIND